MHECSLHCYTPYNQEKPDRPRFLVTLDVGIGDAVAVGLSTIDQMVEDDPLAAGTIDVLCNRLQAQIFEDDPRINRIIETNTVFFPGTHISQWLRGILLEPTSAHVVHFLRQRRYEAIFPGIIAPGLYFRLHSPIMYPHMPEMVSNFRAFRQQADLHLSTVVKQMVHHYFMKTGNTTSTVSQDKEIPLYISSKHMQKAMQTMASLKKGAPKHDGKVLLIAPDTASAVTRPPIALFIAALSQVLAKDPNLIITILPSYTETTRSARLLEALRKSSPDHIFLLPAEPKAHLLEITALIDQANLFVTGDTGVMHLAAAYKQLRERDEAHFEPQNAVKIIALFGGTNPSYYGYKKRTTILGMGRKEQTALRPGFAKESYNLKGRNIFDHITSQQLSEAIMTQLFAEDQ